MDSRDWRTITLDAVDPSAEAVGVTLTGGLIPQHHSCPMVLAPGEQICNRRYPPEVAFHPARLARLAYGVPPALVMFELPSVADR